MICEGSSTKSHGTFVPDRDLTSTWLSKPWSRWPNSWKIVSTSLWVRSAGLPSTGGLMLPMISPRCGSLGAPVCSEFIHAPPRFDSRGCQSA